jgi:CRISPR/Cas system CMR-associated protein Cmr1 (group 7 of RAMP superfamily)
VQSPVFDIKQPPLNYLGYGLGNRNPIHYGASFSIQINFAPYSRTDQKASVQKAFQAFLLFGGLGSRSRRGFGSLLHTASNGNDADIFQVLKLDSRDRLIESIKTFLRCVEKPKLQPKELPSFTCISTESRFLIGNVEADSNQALRWVGEQLQNYRSFWKDRTFPQDHDCIRLYLKDGLVPDSPPRRVAFGLPHNYSFKSLEGWVKKSSLGALADTLIKANVIETIPGDLCFLRFVERYRRKKAKEQFENQLSRLEISREDKESTKKLWAESFPKANIDLFCDNEKMRRASPLFIHIQQLSNGRACPVIALLRAKFLPDESNSCLRISSGRDKKGFPLKGAIDYSAVNGFLEDLIKKGAEEIPMPCD